jgi:small subunit ribosomal protein S12e
MTALKVVLKQSLAIGGLARGLKECCRSLDRNEALICILADDCDQKEYKALIEGLCKSQKVDIIRVESNQVLAEMVGVKKYDKKLQPKKKGKCSSCVIKKFADDSAEVTFLLNEISKQKKN